MFKDNLKKYRLLNGYSMRVLADLLNVSHQTIKKYEDGVLYPNSERLIEIAKIFDIKVSDLVSSFSMPHFSFANYRKRRSLGAKKSKGLEMLISSKVGEYFEILNLANYQSNFDLQKWIEVVDEVDDVEKAAINMRKRLGITGNIPINNLAALLENNHFMIIEIDFEEKFDGFSEFINNTPVIVISSKAHERKRFTLAHELGHLLLKNNTDLDIEKICDKFAAALLLPREALINELQLGYQRNNITINELILICKEYKISVPALVMRLHELNIISDTKKLLLMKKISQYGMRTNDLGLSNEKPTRKEQIILKLDAEKIISRTKALLYLGKTADEYFNFDFDS